MQCVRALLLACLVAAGIGRGTAGADDWNQFRGPDVAGVSRETRVFENVERLRLKVAWKRRIGSGYSGVAVAGGKAITLYAEGDVDVTAAFAVDDGRTLWTYAIGPTYVGHDGSFDGPISTPLIAAGHVYGLGPWGQLFALDPATGEELWSTHLTEEHGLARPLYGFGTSPLLEDGVLVVELGGDGTAVGGFDPATGARKWLAGSDVVLYQSPVPATLDGRRQVVAAGNTRLFGLDAGSGEVLWQWPHQGQGARGAVSLVPLPLPGNRLFLAHHDDASMLVEVRSEGSAVTVDKLWEGRAIRNSFNVPVYLDGHLYTYSSRFLTCVDAATGEAAWRSRDPGDGFLILVDGRLVIVTKQGGVHLAEAMPEAYRELAGRAVFDDLVWSLPSFADGAVYARSLGEIARVDMTSGAARDAAARVAPRPVADSVFGRFLAELEAAEESDRPGLVERFLAAQESFPIVEAPGLVHFVYRGPAEDVALAGDMFGARAERRMTRVPGTDLFYRSLELEPDARLSYVFLRDFEEILDPRNPRRIASSYFKPDMEVAFGGEGIPMSWLAMPQWRPPAHLEEAPAGSRGRLETHEMTSAALGPLRLDVYVPAGYDANGRRYPVAYVHGGREALAEGRVPNSLDHLIGESVEPLIAVFIDAPKPHILRILRILESYDRAMIEEIVPFVDARYRTVASAAGRANVGGGFPAFYAIALTLRHRDLFGAVASQSLVLPETFWHTLDPLFEANAADPPVFYMDWGTYDLRSADEPVDMPELHRELVAELRARGFEIAGGEAHDGTGWASWRNRTHRVYETLFPLRRE